MGLVSTLRQVLSWFRDDAFRRLFLNAGKLLTANSIARLLGFAVTVITARTLGLENYGSLALILAYQLTIGKFVSFNAWQAIIKFGAERIHANDEEGLRQLVKFGFCLDLGSAVIGTVLAMALAGPVVVLIGWDRSIQPLLMLYSILILFSWTGTSVGVLRLFDRFDLLSYSTVLSALTRLGGTLWCLLTEQGLYGFVIVFLITGITGALYQVLASLWVLRKQGVRGIIRQPLYGLCSRFPDIWEYVWTTNLSSTIRMLSREADQLLLAGLVSPSDLGLFRVAKQLSSFLPMLSDPLSQALFPQLASYWSQGRKKEFVTVIKRVTFFTSMAGLGIWLVFLIFGKWIIINIFGSVFQQAYLVTTVYMFALAIFLCCFSIVPSMLAVGLVRQVFFITIMSTFLYFVLLFLLVPMIGILGASLAYVGFFISFYIVTIFYLFPHLRERRGDSH